VERLALATLAQDARALAAVRALLEPTTARALELAGLLAALPAARDHGGRQ
jgi:hypothetical protein